MKSIRFVLFVLLLLALGCTKKPKTTPIDKDVKKYFCYKSGTWWIYKELVRNTIDSYSVYYNEYLQSKDARDDLYEYEKDNIIVFRKGARIGENIWSLSANTAGCLWRVYDTVEESINYQIFQYPFKLGRASVNNALTNNIYPSYTVAGGNYQNVAEIVHDEQPPYHDTFYVSQDAGIIKMSIDRPQFRMILELQRSSIVH